jgi:hypothetical protein
MIKPTDKECMMDSIGCHIDEMRESGHLELFLKEYPECSRAFRECEDFYNKCLIYQEK